MFPRPFGPCWVPVGAYMPRPALTKKPLSPSLQLSSFAKNALCIPDGLKLIGGPTLAEIKGTTATTLYVAPRKLQPGT